MTKTELNGARELRNKIRDEERRLLTLRLSAENLVPILDGLPHGTDVKSRVENLAVKIMESERELIRLRKEFGQAAFTLEEKINRSELDALEKSILTLRYVACMNFLDIQDKLKISDATTFYVHRTATRKILK